MYFKIFFKSDAIARALNRQLKMSRDEKRFTHRRYRYNNYVNENALYSMNRIKLGAIHTLLYILYITFLTLAKLVRIKTLRTTLNRCTKQSLMVQQIIHRARPQTRRSSMRSKTRLREFISFLLITHRALHEYTWLKCETRIQCRENKTKVSG